jgi:hypothetical protein
MANPRMSDIVAVLLDQCGRTYATEIGFEPSKNTPSALFRLLCSALLFSARIQSSIAVAAAEALAAQGWTTAEKLAGSTGAERAKTLNQAGYARYDEQTSRWLGETADLLLDRYGGDLRTLREEAGRDPAKKRRLLKEFKGIGDVGVDIFFRKVQGTWEELYPFADRRALHAAKTLNLGDDAKALSQLVDRKDFPRLVAALVRVRQADDAERVRRVAAGEPTNGEG